MRHIHLAYLLGAAALLQASGAQSAQPIAMRCTELARSTEGFGLGGGQTVGQVYNLRIDEAGQITWNGMVMLNPYASETTISFNMPPQKGYFGYKPLSERYNIDRESGRYQSEKATGLCKAAAPET